MHDEDITSSPEGAEEALCARREDAELAAELHGILSAAAPGDLGAAVLQLRGILASFGSNQRLQLVIAGALRDAFSARPPEFASAVASLLWRVGEVHGTTIPAALLSVMRPDELTAAITGAAKPEAVAALVASIALDLCRSDMLSVAMRHYPEGVRAQMSRWVQEEAPEAVVALLSGAGFPEADIRVSLERAHNAGGQLGHLVAAYGSAVERDAPGATT